MATCYEARPLFFVLAFCLALCHVDVPSKISNKKMCADDKCQTTISEGRAVKLYRSDNPKFLSFNENDVIFIKSKGAGRVPYLWSGEANGQFGYFPLSHVKEIQVFVKIPMSLVSTGDEVKEPEKQIKSSTPPPPPPPEMKETDETEIEEDEPNTVKIEEEESEESLTEVEKDETEIDEEEEAPPKMSETNQQFNTKEESITHQADQIMNVYNQINEDLQKSKKKDATTHNEPVQAEPQIKPSSQNSESKFTETPYQSSDIIRDPMQTSHSDKLEQAHQTHSQDSARPTRVHDDSVSRLIEATPAATIFTSQSAYTVFDGTTLFDGVTPGSEAHQTATTSRFTYEKPTEKVTRAFVETSVTNQASSTESSKQTSVNIESSKQASVNIDPSASLFVAPSTSSSSRSFNPNSQHDTFVKKTLAMHPGIEDVPSRERQREDISKPKYGDTLAGFAGKSVFQPDKPPHSVAENRETSDKPSVPQIGNFMKVFEVYMKYILDMSPTAVQNFLEQEPLGIPPTILLFYTIIGIFFSLFFVIICTCFSGTSQKPRTDPIVIIRNLEEKLFITTKEKENLEDEIQVMKENVCTLQQNMELQKSSTGSAESDLHRQKLLNEDLKEINESLGQQLNNVKIECEDFRCTNEKKDKKLKTLEKEKTKVTNECKTICEKHLQLTLELADKEMENSGLHSRIETLTDQIQHLETRKQQLLEEEEQWSEKYLELTENWEQSQAQYLQMRETLDFKENEFEQMKECFLQLKAFEESQEADVSVDYHAGSPSMQDKIQSMLDVSRVKAMLTAAEEENNALHKSRQIEVECRLELEDQIEAMKRDVETFQADKTKAIRQNDEAQTKLNVLTTYFKEKEMQFQRELGEHEILKKQNINKLGTAEERANFSESELQSYRSQIEDLKHEINKAERDFRAQIAANEKKAHENWLATRTAERELKESRVECTMLRQKLTELERRPMHASIIRPLPTRGSGHLEMVNGPPLLPPFPPGEHPGGRKDLMPPGRDDQSKPPMKSPSPNFRPPPRPSPPNFRPPPPMKKRGPPPNMSDAFPPWQMLPPGPGPRLPFGNRPPPPPPPSKMNPPRGPHFGSHPPPPMMPLHSQHRSLSDFSPLPEKHPISKQHSQV